MNPGWTDYEQTGRNKSVHTVSMETYQESEYKQSSAAELLKVLVADSVPDCFFCLLLLRCPISCAAGVSVCPADLPNLYRHLEEHLAASSLSRLSTADDFAPRRPQIQHLYLNDRLLQNLLHHAALNSNTKSLLVTFFTQSH